MEIHNKKNDLDHHDIPNYKIFNYLCNKAQTRREAPSQTKYN